MQELIRDNPLLAKMQNGLIYVLADLVEDVMGEGEHVHRDEGMPMGRT